MSRVIAVVTGSRADFGLLSPVIRAVEEHDDLDLHLLVTGTHLLPPAETINEILETFPVTDRITMQEAGAEGFDADAAALGRGVVGFAKRFAGHRPDFVVVLGDRIEPFAAASAAAVAGIRVAHVHGGDRAEGIADESLRHAITKLAHLHLAATGTSVERIICMGEEPGRVHLVGSPALDDLDDLPPLRTNEYERLGRPRIVVLLHPDGGDPEDQWSNAERLLRLCKAQGETLVLHPNHDPGRSSIMEAIEQSGCRHVPHLPRHRFVGLLRRAKVLVGNSSAGVIECAALGTRCINVGPRQTGRDMPEHVTDVADWDMGTIDIALEQLDQPLAPFRHPYGDGDAGRRIADLLATCDLGTHGVRKVCTY